ncbi:MAG: PEP-CTERM sorting domain-containing protein [Phycisphaeraceae bacterium]|nr:MAG: PEP-CTERM sorting domain-containing protein [Phycisphaeraceae bacterium]
MKSRATKGHVWAIVAAGLACGLGTAAANAGAVVMDLHADNDVFGHRTSGQNNRTATYTVGNQKYTTTLTPPTPGEIPNTSGDFFFNTLSTWANAHAGWTFASAVHMLSDNSLKVHTYDALHNVDLQGVQLHIEYVPGQGDPTSNVHWIQVVNDNWNITAPNAADRGPGHNERVVDLHSTATSPYYDDGFAADGREFYDRPWRDPAQTMFWQAELFLAVGPAAGSPGLVTLYRPGLQWGWVTTVETVPAPGTMGLIAAGVFACVRRRKD